MPYEKLCRIYTWKSGEGSGEPILHKKPVGLRFRPQEVTYLVTYKQQGYQDLPELYTECHPL